jgi:hypothetical protein
MRTSRKRSSRNGAPLVTVLNLDDALHVAFEKATTQQILAILQGILKLRAAGAGQSPQSSSPPPAAQATSSSTELEGSSASGTTGTPLASPSTS